MSAMTNSRTKTTFIGAKVWHDSRIAANFRANPLPDPVFRGVWLP